MPSSHRVLQYQNFPPPDLSGTILLLPRSLLRNDPSDLPAKRAYSGHDCAKCVPDEQKITECEQNNIEITKSEYESPYLLHSKLGAFYADVKYGIKDEDILGAIKWHTTGHPDMTMLEKIVFVADYIEPYRNKAANLDTIRYLAFTDIDKAVLQILNDTINYLNKKGNPIDSITLDTYNFYKCK